ncbi:MAG: 30S ribosomal protein THX [Stenotrophomonas sp.]
MGKGDRKTAKGKRFSSSYGNVRRHALPGAVVHAGGSAAPVAAAAPVVKKAVVKKATARKTVAKKAAAAE